MSVAPSFGSMTYRDPVGLHTFLEEAADHRPEATALRAGDEQWTFAELDAMANSAAAFLAGRGIGVGDRVAMMAGNRPEFVMMVFGVLKLGAAVVMVSPSWKQAEVGHAFSLTSPALVVCDGETPDVLDGLIANDAIVHLDRDGVHADLVASPAVRPQTVTDWANREAVLVFSSGTTGMPKAVRHLHGSLEVGTAHWVSALGLGPDDRIQVATPPFHILGLLNLLAAAAAGASVRLHPRFDLDALLQHIEADGITLEMAVAPIALAMANHPDLERYDLSSLRYIMWGATPVTESVARRVTERTGIEFLPAYGASEVPVITANHVGHPDSWRLDSAGLLLHDVEMRVIDLETGELVSPGATGEIQLKSPSMMAGYLPEEANVDAFDDGWYRTGDVGWVEADGWLHLTDRVKEMIKVKGFQVAPAEVEAVLHGHPDVADCAVFGVADEASGELVVGAVQLRADATATAGDLQTVVAEQLASYKKLSALHVVDEIPRLPSGKVLRRVLRDRFTGN
ncbi:MAG: long-chain acyl-CoA synthetase [Candidatus Aldehydirespiratoraceae bacterium]|jgi:long-chain acyl-CoA synthetase